MACSFLAVDLEETEMGGRSYDISNQAMRNSRTPSNTSSKDINTHEFCWGLNDKEQLGGARGSKVRKINRVEAWGVFWVADGYSLVCEYFR
jgi:hypothetical protein